MGSFTPQLLTQLLPGPPPAATSPARDQGVQCKSPATPNTAVGHLVPHKKKGHTMVKIEALGYFPSLQLGWKAWVRGAVPSITPAHAKHRRCHQRSHPEHAAAAKKKLIWVQFKPPPGNGDGMGARLSGFTPRGEEKLPQEAGQDPAAPGAANLPLAGAGGRARREEAPREQCGEGSNAACYSGSREEARRSREGESRQQKREEALWASSARPGAGTSAPLSGCLSGWLAVRLSPAMCGASPGCPARQRHGEGSSGSPLRTPCGRQGASSSAPRTAGTPIPSSGGGLREHRDAPLPSSPRVPSPPDPPYLGSGGAQHHTGGGRRSPARPRIPARAALPAAPGLGWA